MFSQVSVCPQGGVCLWGECLPHPLGRHPPGQTPLGQTPPWQTPLGRHPPGQTPFPGQTPPGQTSPRQTPPAQCMLGYIPPCPVHAGIHPPAQCMLGYGLQAGGTHPTGMHSCFKKVSRRCQEMFKTHLQFVVTTLLLLGLPSPVPSILIYESYSH